MLASGDTPKTRSSEGRLVAQMIAVEAQGRFTLTAPQSVPVWETLYVNVPQIKFSQSAAS